jgi:orotidine-5'-phosphate decarboxylase
MRIQNIDAGTPCAASEGEYMQKGAECIVTPHAMAQGGDAVATIKAGYRQRNGTTTGAVIVSSSRAILYASSGDDFAQAARNEAIRTRDVLKAAALG